MKTRFIAILVIVLLVLGTSAYSIYYLTRPQNPVELRVFVAASLTHAVQDNTSLQAFEQENNVKLLFNIGGSDSLYQQIYSGSPADVFMAADFSWLNKLNENSLLYGNQYWNFTSNILVVILPPDNPKNITSLLDLANSGVRIAVTAWTVPVGRYTNITLTKIDKTWGNPMASSYRGSAWEHYREHVIANIVTYETNVEQVVGKVLTGSVDAGFAYMSDASFLGQSKLKYIPIPTDVNVQAKYGIGIVNASTHYDLATKYVNFWLSQDGQALLAKYGFGATLSNTPGIIRYTIFEVQSASNDEVSMPYATRMVHPTPL